MKPPEKAHLIPPLKPATPPSGSPINDSARIAALRDLDLIDNGAPEALDRLSRLAASVLAAPMALVTLVGDAKMVMLGQYGLDGELAEQREMPLSRTFGGADPGDPGDGPGDGHGGRRRGDRDRGAGEDLAPARLSLRPGLRARPAGRGRPGAGRRRPA